MKKKWLLLALILIPLFGAIVTAQIDPNSDTRVALALKPIASATPPVSNPQDDDLKVQEQIIAELRKLRSEKEGWQIEKQGLQGQITILTRMVSVETERGDFFKTAALAAQQVDKNSQKMDANSTFIQTSLETRIAEKNNRIAELTDDLRSCQSNQKWIAGISAVGGGLLGYTLRGTLNNAGIGNNNYTVPNFGLYRPTQTKPPAFTILK